MGQRQVSRHSRVLTALSPSGSHGPVCRNVTRGRVGRRARLGHRPRSFGPSHTARRRNRASAPARPTRRSRRARRLLPRGRTRSTRWRSSKDDAIVNGWPGLPVRVARVDLLDAHGFQYRRAHLRRLGQCAGMSPEDAAAGRRCSRRRRPTFSWSSGSAASPRSDRADSRSASRGS